MNASYVCLYMIFIFLQAILLLTNRPKMLLGGLSTENENLGGLFVVVVLTLIIYCKNVLYKHARVILIT